MAFDLKSHVTYLYEVADTVQAVMQQLEHSHPYRLVWQSKVCVCVCVCVCVYLFMPVYVYMYVYICVCTYVYVCGGGGSLLLVHLWCGGVCVCCTSMYKLLPSHGRSQSQKFGGLINFIILIKRCIAD